MDCRFGIEIDEIGEADIWDEKKRVVRVNAMENMRLNRHYCEGDSPKSREHRQEHD